jgi:hypothetical protein
MIQHINYICICIKIFQCNFARLLSDLDKVNFVAQYLCRNIYTIGEKHLKSVNPTTNTWQGC